MNTKCTCNTCALSKQVKEALDSGDLARIRKTVNELWVAYESEGLDAEILRLANHEFREGEVCVQENDYGDKIRFVKIIEDNDDDIFKIKPVTAWFQRTTQTSNFEVECHVSRLRKNKDVR